METLTPQQAAIADTTDGVTAIGAAGTGKTTALIHRYLRVAQSRRSGRVAFLARNRSNAASVRRRVLPELRGGFDHVAITTVWGLALDVLSRNGDVSLLPPGHYRGRVARALRREEGHPELWPSLHHLIARPAFPGQAATALLALGASNEPDDRVLERADAAGVLARWVELLSFRDRLAEELAAEGLVVSSHVVSAAVDAARHRRPTDVALDEFLIDDFEALTPTELAFLTVVATRDESTLVWAGDPDGWSGRPPASATPPPVTLTETSPPLTLDRRFRAPASPELVESRHPSMEPEAVAADLLAAHRRGVPWHEMAVIGLRGLGDIGRALARHDIPATGANRSPDADDAVARELLRAIAEREALNTPASLSDHAHAAFAERLGHLVTPAGSFVTALDDRAIDAGVAVVDDVQRFASRSPSATLADYLDTFEDRAWPGSHEDDADPADIDAVALVTPQQCLGREWQLTVVAGCIEGWIPIHERTPAFFDVAFVDGFVLDAGARHDAVLASERRRFRSITTRATKGVVATAAPEPGVLVSRFVDSWQRRKAALALDAPVRVASVEPTPGAAPVWPTRALRLSATQLDTYEDCPLKYALRYAAGVRSEAGLHADLGSLVHDVLADFLDPGKKELVTRERLLELADGAWHDDIATYRPQAEEVRRDYYDMLERWWEQEGVDIAGGGIEVLATERPFEVDIGPHVITGQIDRIDRVANGLRVLDYKTGKSKPKKDEVAENVQLASYYLAAIRDPEIASWGEPTCLSLLYLRSMTTLNQDITPGHESAIEVRILEAAAQILDEQFEPSVAADCDHCEFKRLCPLWPEGLQVGQA